MSNDPLEALCEAIRALPVMAATPALNELFREDIIHFKEAIECGRAINTLRQLVRKLDAHNAGA